LYPDPRSRSCTPSNRRLRVGNETVKQHARSVPICPDLSGRPDSTSHGLPPSVVARLVRHLGFAHALGFQGVADDPEG
jgi:hypothetical protein